MDAPTHFQRIFVVTPFVPRHLLDFRRHFAALHGMDFPLDPPFVPHQGRTQSDVDRFDFQGAKECDCAA
jgi:hypothetical protein